MTSSWLNSFSTSWATLVCKRYLVILVSVAGLTFLCGWYSTRLTLEADFKELLPQDSRAVHDYQRFRERVGGSGDYVIVVENRDFEKATRYVNKLVRTLKDKTPPGVIHYIDFKLTAKRKLLDEYGYLYINLADLRHISDRLAAKAAWEQRCGPGARQKPESTCPADPGFTIEDIERRYVEAATKTTRNINDYYTSDDGELIAILVRPVGDAADFRGIEQFLATIEPIIRSVDPAKFDPSIKLHFTGPFTGPYEESKVMRRDLATTAIVCAVLVLLVLVVYYGRLRSILFVFCGGVFGLVWMFAFTMALYGKLNTVTSFLGAIVLGNGINNAIIFVSRYTEERQMGNGLRDALDTAIRTTFRATFVAAATTAVVYGALYLSEMQGHRQFGVIGFFGMVACWVATYLAVPPLICLVERIRPDPFGQLPESRFSIGRSIYNAIEGNPVRWVRAGLILTAAGMVSMLLFLRSPWEDDFTKVRSATSLKSGHHFINRLIMDRIFDQSLTPAVVLVDDPKDTPIVAAELDKLRFQPDPIIASVRYADSILPDHQTEKLEILRRMRAIVSTSDLGFLPPSKRDKLLSLLGGTNELKPLTIADIPEELIRGFREKDGSIDKLVYVFPDNRRDLSQRRNLEAFVDATRSVRLPDGRSITSASEQTMVLDSILITIRTAPQIILASYISIILLVIATFPSVRASVTLLISFTASVLMVFLAFFLMNEKLTFLNFIALPLTMGIGIDYGTNMYSRYELDGEGSIREVLESTGGAVLLCSLTTQIGYISLLAADNQLLVHFGWLCLFGELTTAGTAVVILPAYLLWRERKRNA